MKAYKQPAGHDKSTSNFKSRSKQKRCRDHKSKATRHEKELMERRNKLNEAIKHFEDMMKSPRIKDTSGLGYNKRSSSIKEGESSKSGEKKE